MPETCANCGRTIGNLETPQVFKQHVVCAACWAVLNQQGHAIPRAF